MGIHRAARVAAAACLLTMAGALIAPSAVASHSDPKPITTTSWYQDSVSESLFYDKGCNVANGVESGTEPGAPLVMMSFGNPEKIDASTWGASMYSQPTQSTVQIKQAIQQWGKGFYICLDSSLRASTDVKIGAGVTNQFPSSWDRNTANNHGQQWGTMIKNANDWFSTNGYASVVRAVGGSDVELGYKGPNESRGWVDGYNSVTNTGFLYNFGDAAGCQTFSSGDANSCGTTSYPGWTSADVYYVSYEVPLAFPLPQIYNTGGTNAEQWVMISQWAVNNGKGKLSFTGPLTQYQACSQVGGCSGTNNTASDAWTQMKNKMDAKPDTVSDMAKSTDIKWQNP